MFRLCFFLLNLQLLIACKSKGQSMDGDHVKLMMESNIVFYEDRLTDTTTVSGTIRVSFTDSLNLQPQSAEIVILRMKGGSNFIYFYSQENSFDENQNQLLEKYSAKIESIFMNGEYQFEGNKKWMMGTRLDFSYSFKIFPN